MFQFLTYLLHKQIIEMCHSQNLRRPLLVPCPTQCVVQKILSRGVIWVPSITPHDVHLSENKMTT